MMNRQVQQQDNNLTIEQKSPMPDVNNAKRFEPHSTSCLLGKGKVMSCLIRAFAIDQSFHKLGIDNDPEIIVKVQELRDLHNKFMLHFVGSKTLTTDEFDKYLTEYHLKLFYCEMMFK